MPKQALNNTKLFMNKAFWRKVCYIACALTVLSSAYTLWTNRFLYFAIRLTQAEQVTVTDCTPPLRLTEEQWDGIMGHGILTADPEAQPLQAVTQRHTICVTLPSGKDYTMQIGILGEEPILLTEQQVYLCTGGNPDIISSWGTADCPSYPAAAASIL